MPDVEGLTPSSGNEMVWIVPILVWVAALLFAAIAVWRGPRPVTWGIVTDKLLRYLFFFPLGVQGLWAFVGHAIFPEESAASIGWAPSPFQFEVSVANLGLALGSLYAAFSGFQARAAMAIAASCFLVGAGIGHINEMIEDANFAPGNAGPIMVTDFLTPIAILVLLLLQPQARKAFSGPRISEQLARARADLQKGIGAKPADGKEQLQQGMGIARKAMTKYKTALGDLAKK